MSSETADSAQAWSDGVRSFVRFLKASIQCSVPVQKKKTKTNDNKKTQTKKKPQHSLKKPTQKQNPGIVKKY